MTKTIIHSVLLFDGTTVRPNATVAFDSQTGQITSVSDSGGSSTSGEGNIIDGTGHTLLPGLIDAHMHAHDLHLPPEADRSQILKTPLKCGVTTVCDMMSDPGTVHQMRRDIRQEADEARAAGQDGKVTRADLKSSLFGALVDGGWPKPIVLGHHPTDDVKAIVSTWPSVTIDTASDFIKGQKENGADYIKLMQEDGCSLAIPTKSIPHASLELQTAVVKEAHAAGFVVAGHATSIESTEIVLNSGADGLTHTFIDQPPTDAIIALYKKTGAFVIPTLTVLSSLTNEESDLRRKFANIASEHALIDQFTKDNKLDVIGMKAECSKIENAYESVKRLKAAGIDILAGTDSVAGLKGTAIGPSLWMELELYVERCGMSVVDALTAATSVIAKRLKFGDRGVVAVGKRADLVLVKGNVTENLAALWEGAGIVGVWKEGLKAA